MYDIKGRFRQETRETLILAAPVVLTQLAHISLGFVDTIMVGRLGAGPLAGVALGSSLFFTVMVLCMGVVMAVGPMVSQAFGAGEHDPIGRSVRQGLWLALVLAVAAIALLWNTAPLLLALGQDPETVQTAAGYVRAIMWGAFPFLGFVALRSFVEGLSRPRVVTVIAFLGVGLNIGCNYVLMFGKLGFPELGVVGTGWASTIVYSSNFIILWVYIAKGRPFAVYRVFERIGKPDPHYFRELFRIGWPIGASFGIESSLFMITVVMMGWIGTTALAAHQVAIQCAAFTFMVPLGIGLATSVRVGQAAGRNDPDGVATAGLVGLVLSSLFMSLTALAFVVLPRWIIGLYLDLGAPENAEVVAMATVLLGVAAVFQLFDGAQVTISGALRGLKDTRQPMMLAMMAYWGLGLTASYVLGFPLGYGARGLWWGLVLGLAAAAVLLTWRFQRMLATIDSTR